MIICQKLYFELVYSFFTKAGQVFTNFVCGIIKNINKQYKLKTFFIIFNVFMEKTKIDCMYLKRFQPEVNVDMSTV